MKQSSRAFRRSVVDHWNDPDRSEGLWIWRRKTRPRARPRSTAARASP